MTALKEAEADAASLDAGGEVSRHKREEDARKTSKFVTFFVCGKSRVMLSFLLLVLTKN